MTGVGYYLQEQLTVDPTTGQVTRYFDFFVMVMVFVLLDLPSSLPKKLFQIIVMTPGNTSLLWLSMFLLTSVAVWRKMPPTPLAFSDLRPGNSFSFFLPFSFSFFFFLSPHPSPQW